MPAHLAAGRVIYPPYQKGALAIEGEIGSNTENWVCAVPINSLASWSVKQKWWASLVSG